LIERAGAGILGSNLTILTHENLRFEAIKFAAMKFDFTKYATNGSANKFLEKTNLRKIIFR